MKLQREKWLRWENSVASQWAASYLLILLIPIFTMPFSSRYISKMMVSEIEKADHAVLSSLQADIDQSLESAHAVFSFIFRSAEFSDTARHRSDSLSFRTDGAAFMKSLRAYRSSAGVGEVLVYWTQNDYLLINDTFTKSAQVFGARQFNVPDSIPQEEWLELLGRKYNNQFLISRHFSIRPTGSGIVYAHSIENQACGRVNVFVNIPLTAMQSIAKRLDGGILLLLDENNEVLAAYGEQEISPLKIPEISGK